MVLPLTGSTAGRDSIPASYTEYFFSSRDLRMVGQRCLRSDVSRTNDSRLNVVGPRQTLLCLTDTYDDIDDDTSLVSSSKDELALPSSIRKNTYLETNLSLALQLMR